MPSRDQTGTEPEGVTTFTEFVIEIRVVFSGIKPADGQTNKQDVGSHFTFALSISSKWRQ